MLRARRTSASAADGFLPTPWTCEDAAIVERLDGDRDWARELCRIAVIWRDPGQVSIHDLFVAAAPDVSDRKAFETAVQRELLRDPELVDAWQGFVEDQRAT